MGLEIKPTHINLGQLNPGQKREFDYTIFNTSSQDIRVLPWAACGCTVPSVVNNIVPANSFTKLKAVFDSTGKSGVQEKTMGINYTESGEAKSISVSFTAKI